VSFWDQAHEIDVYEVANEGDYGCLGKDYPQPVEARIRALCGLDGFLEIIEKIDFRDEIDTLNTSHTFLVNWCAKAAPPPVTISLEEFGRRTGLGLEGAKKLKPENIAGFYVDDKGETRVDFARFEKRFGIREEEAVDARATNC
jgi:hypothetical protein